MAGRVVAELGRPETPEETAARTAEASRRHRANQTVRNLVASLLASLVIVLVLVLVVVRPDQAPSGSIDYLAVAEQAQDGLDAPIAAPALPEGWRANAAELRTVGDVRVWYVGFVTPEGEFIALNQGINANAVWVDNLLDGAASTGQADISGVEWSVYDHRDENDPGNLAYALTTEREDSTYVLYGTAGDREFETLATAIGVDQ